MWMSSSVCIGMNNVFSTWIPAKPMHCGSPHVSPSHTSIMRPSTAEPASQTTHNNTVTTPRHLGCSPRPTRAQARTSVLQRSGSRTTQPSRSYAIGTPLGQWL